MVSGLKKANHGGIRVFVNAEFFDACLCESFDVIEVAHFAVAYECDCRALVAFACCSAYAMEVNWRVCGYVEVYDVGDAFNV